MNGVGYETVAVLLGSLLRSTIRKSYEYYVIQEVRECEWKSRQEITYNSLVSLHSRKRVKGGKRKFT